MSEETPTFRNPLGFHGREEYLQWLFELFEDVATTKVPRLAVVAAESGLGKSRLVQALYQRLTVASEWDPDDYWPDAFSNAGDNLEVNPSFEGIKVDRARLPRFLWLGMRCQDPERRNSTAEGCPLPDVQKALARQVSVIWAMGSYGGRIWERLQRLVPSTRTELVELGVEGALEEAANFLPAGRVMAKSVRALWESHKAGGEEARSVEGRVREDREGAGDLLLKGLGQLMRSEERLPVVLWLDDAQWADTETLGFLGKLFFGAKQAQWPLLVVATHWEREWREAVQQKLSKEKSLTGFKDYEFAKDGEEKSRRTEVRFLEPAGEKALHELLAESLPGLTTGQRDLLVRKAGGNFLTMVENIGELCQFSRNFEERDRGKPLVESAVKNIENWESERERRVKQRFDRLCESVQDLLGWGSQMGRRLIVEALTRFAVGKKVEGPSERLAECVDPLAILGGANSDIREFRDRAYRRVAEKFFDDFLDEDRSALDAVLAEVLADWVSACFDTDGELVSAGDIIPDPGEGLPLLSSSPTDRADVLDMACTVLPFWGKNSTDRLVQSGLRARCLLVHEYAQQRVWDRCLKAGKLLKGIDWRAVPEASLGLVFREELSVALRISGALDVAGELVGSLVARFRKSGADGSRSKLVWSLQELGELDYKRSRLEEAAARHQEALDLRRMLVEEADTPENRLHLALSLNGLGLLHFERGDFDEATTSWNEALAFLRSLVVERPTLESRPHLALTLANLGFLDFEREACDEAVVKWDEAVSVRRALVDDMNTPESRSDLAISLSNLAELNRKRGQIECAITLNQEALTSFQALADELRTPESSLELAFSLSNQGLLDFESGDLEGAEAKLQKALDLCRPLADELGMPESRSILALALDNCGQLRRRRGDLEGAAAKWKEALALLRELADEIRTPESRSRLALTLSNLCLLDFERGNLEEAAGEWEEALALRQMLSDELGSGLLPDRSRLARPRWRAC